MSSIILNPSFDGNVIRDNGGGGAGESFSSLRTGAGTAHNNSPSDTTPVNILSTPTTDEYRLNKRGVCIFTTGLSVKATVTAVTFSMYGNGKSSSLGGNAEIVTTAPASDTTLANTDYAIAQFGSSALATGIAFSALSTTGRSTFTFNATGISYVQTQVTAGDKVRIGIISSFDLANSAPTWSSTVESYWQTYWTAQGSDKMPELTITYTAPNTSASFFIKMISP